MITVAIWAALVFFYLWIGFVILLLVEKDLERTGETFDSKHWFPITFWTIFWLPGVIHTIGEEIKKWAMVEYVLWKAKREDRKNDS